MSMVSKNTKNLYDEMIARHQEEVDSLPMKFAFCMRQFSEIMEEWGLDAKEDADKIVRIGGGGFVQKKDLELVKDMFLRHEEELKEEVAADETGDGFIYDMFVSELANHEYGYTGDVSEALDALGYTLFDIEQDRRLIHGLKMACTQLREEE